MGRGAIPTLVAVASLLLLAACGADGSPAAGAVVESCDRGEAADVAGLLPDDVIVEWRHGKAGGAVDSPFLLQSDPPRAKDRLR